MKTSYFNFGIVLEVVLQRLGNYSQGFLLGMFPMGMDGKIVLVVPRNEWEKIPVDTA